MFRKGKGKVMPKGGSMDLDKILDMIEEESDAYHMYKKYAKSFNQKGLSEVASIFAKIADMELKHLYWLGKVYEYLEAKGY